MRCGQKWCCLCKPSLGKPLKGLESGSPRRLYGTAVLPWGSWSQKRKTLCTLPGRIPQRVTRSFFSMKLTSPCATICSSVEKVIPSGVIISCTGREFESILQNFLELMKSYNNSNFNYKRKKTLKLRSSLYLGWVLCVVVESESCFPLIG